MGSSDDGGSESGWKPDCKVVEMTQHGRGEMADGDLDRNGVMVLGVVVIARNGKRYFAMVSCC